MARTVTVGLAANVADYLRGVGQAEVKTRGFAEELSASAKQGELSAMAVDKFGKEALGASRDVSRLGSAAEDATDEVRQLDRAMDRVGGTFSGTIHDVRTLDSEIDRTSTSVLDLARAVSRDPGDSGLLRQLTRERGRLKRLLDVKDLLPGEDDGKDSGERVGRGFRSRFVVSVGTAAVEAGATLSRAIGASFGGLPPQAQAAIGASLVAAVVAAAPFVTAAVAGAVTAGVGAGTIGAGLLLAARDNRVKEAGAALGQTVLAGLEDASGVLTGPLLRSIGILRDGFRDLQPDIARAFQAVSPYVDDLARGVVALVRNAMPGFLKMLERSGPLLELLGRELGDLGRSFGNFFDLISRSTKGNTLALQGLFNLIESSVEFLGKLLYRGGQAYEFFAKGVNLASGNLGGFIDLTVRSNDELRQSTEDTRTAFERLGEGAQNEITALSSAGVGATLMSDRTKILGSTLAGAAQQAGSLAAALDILNGSALGGREAQRNYQAAIDAVTDSIKANGKTLDETTPKGRANAQALDDLAKAAQTNADKVFEQTAATEGTAAAQEKAKAAYMAGREQLIKSAMQMGLSKDAAKKLADQIYAVPKNWNTKFSADTATASTAITGLKKQVASLSGKTITITTRFVTSGSSQGEHIVGGIGAGTQRRRWGGITEHAQSGLLREAAMFTPRSPARYAFAEPATGGEAFVPKYGNWGQSMGILNRAAGWYGAQVMPKAMPRPVVNVSVTPVAPNGDRLMSEVVNKVRYVVRVDGGGNVQRALGQ